jgi:shikimate kinase
MSKNIDELIQNKGLYDEIELIKEDYHAIDAILMGKYKINLFCVECNDMRVFTSVPSAISFEKRHIIISLPTRIDEKTEYVQHDVDKVIEDFTTHNVKDIFNRQFDVLIINLSCSMDEQHFITVIVRLRNNKIQKVGQFPSLATLASNSLGKNKKELGKYSSEYIRAVGLFAHGIGIGSMVYLRRIIEFLVEEAHKEQKSMPSWDENIYVNSTFSERVKMLENTLPQIFVDNRKTAYSIISKGIHELDEKECLNLFPIFQEFVLLILEKRIAEKEKVERENNLTKVMNKEHEKLSYAQNN